MKCPTCGKEFEPKRVRDKHCSKACGKNIATKRWRIRTVFGITLEQYEAMSTKCEICGEEVVGRNRHLDHNHSTGQLRGILCSRCNHGVGLFRDSTELLRKAVAYLERHGS